MVTVWPATVNVAVRGEFGRFFATVKLIVPFPVPDAGAVDVTHVALLVTVQPHPAPVVTVTEPVPPLLENWKVVEDKTDVQLMPACVTVTTIPAMVTVPVRGVADGLAATV